MSSLAEIRTERLKKLKRYEATRGSAYPVSVSRTHSLEALRREFSTFVDGGATVSVAGRVLALRGQGALVFAVIDDGTAHIQGVFKRDVLGEDEHTLFVDTVDLGDFVSFSGDCFSTDRGEESVLVLSWALVSKSLRPLPDKWHGLKDSDERFRRRYLETTMDTGARERFLTRSRMITFFRSKLSDAGFVEFETPILQPLAGGANALPFITHHNALDRDLYLRIAPELYLKKLLIGGFPKVYEIGRSFRNEGIDVTHNPEFTTVEWYEAYSDASAQRAFVEALIRELVHTLLGGSTLLFGEHEIDVAAPFAVRKYYDLFAEYTDIPDARGCALDELIDAAERLGSARTELTTREKVLDALYKRVCRPALIQPTFVVDYPRAMLPLAKRTEGDADLVDAFQLIIGGTELVKAFSELNDPIDQQERFMEESQHRTQGDAEAQPHDEDFIEALEYGMPPAGGVGIGLDRLVMLLTNTHNIRESIYFPTLREKE